MGWGSFLLGGTVFGIIGFLVGGAFGYLAKAEESTDNRNQLIDALTQLKPGEEYGIHVQLTKDKSWFGPPDDDDDDEDFSPDFDPTPTPRFNMSNN